LSRAHDCALAAWAHADDGRVPLGLRNPAAYVAAALVALERDDLPSVRRHLGEARVCRGLVDDVVSRAVAAGVQAHLDADAGAAVPPLRGDQALVSRCDVQDPWLVGWLRLQTAKIAVTHGRPDDALLALALLSPDDGPSAEIVAATAYAEQGRTVALGRTLAQSTGDDRSPVSQVDRLLLEAVCAADRHSPQSSAALVERALEVASHDGVRRPFREAPPCVRRVLSDHRDLMDRHPWLWGEGQPRARAVACSPGAPVEPLTPKELEVLGLLEELLSTQEIAEKMYVSVNTVRTHVRSILRKLDVHRRNGAVRRARELGLLEGPSPPGLSITPQG
jgi:LuxR family maltose regulon positive regulatory protein